MRIYKKFLLLLALVFLLILLLNFIPPYLWSHGRKILLQETDYQELLKAGRDIINQAENEGHFKKAQGRLGLPKYVKIPKAIRMLQLQIFGLGKVITLDETRRLTISFSNRAMGSFGVCIYPENFTKPVEAYRYGDKELLPGLWYIDNKCRNFEYDKKIDIMIKKNKFLKEG
jgi:hypothetical protein